MSKPAAIYARGTAPYRSKNEIPMSDAELTRLKSDMPDDPVRLQAGFLACRTCGVAVQRTSGVDQEIQVTSSGYAVEGMAAMTQAAASAQRPRQLTFALCPLHRRTEELAEGLVQSPANPLALHQVTTALDALSFVAPDRVEHMAYLDREGVTVLVRHLSRLGIDARWVSRFVPSMMVEANPNSCAPYAWGHVMPGMRQQLRTGYANLLRERVAKNAPPVKITPPRVRDQANNAMIPIAGGCMFCGIGHQKAPATEVAQEGREYVARDLWTPKRVGLQQLGGAISPEMLSGYLCHSCNDVVEHVGAMGPTALERALVTAVVPEGLDKLGWNQLRVNGLIGWGAACASLLRRGEPQPPPNRTPWAHLPDLEALTEQLRRRLG